MTSSPNLEPGGHHLSPVFGGDGASASPPSARRPRRAAIRFPILGVAIVAAVWGGAHWAANAAYDDALSSFESAVEKAESSQSELADELRAFTETAEAAGTVAEADTGNLMDASAREALDTALAEGADAAATAAESTEVSLPHADEKPGWTWELFGEAAELSTDGDDAAEKRAAFDDAAEALGAAQTAAEDAGTAAVVAAAESAGDFEAAHISARNVDIVTLRSTADWLAGATTMDATTADAYVDLESAATAMLESEAAEIAEKQGPLYDARVQIEAFARELAPGVLLDFDWSQYVNGHGDGQSMGGEATWWYGSPGYSTIELSNSVAVHWPGSASQALVAHEVGHAISVKCEGMYDDSNQESIEAWATAWAISMGFTDDANGTSAYGAPPQAMIDAAAGCR